MDGGSEEGTSEGDGRGVEEGSLTGMGASESPGAIQGGASLPHRQKPLRLPESPKPGAEENLAQLHSLFALANLVIAGHMLRKAQMA